MTTEHDDETRTCENVRSPGGVAATPKGLLFRKPSYKCTAKPVVEVA